MIYIYIGNRSDDGKQEKPSGAGRTNLLIIANYANENIMSPVLSQISLEGWY